MKPVRLTTYTRFSGCGAKLGPGLLDKALCGLTQPAYPQLLGDYTTSEDCGIYAINDTEALIQTIDFFPPIVDDPFIFGRIAAANALSDIYAMGGRPLTAVSVVCFPKDDLDLSYLREITAGGLDALIEAETALVGGHSVDDPEPKFGYSVTGILKIAGMLRNNTPRRGDALFLTKALGTGLINTALRAELVSDRALQASIRSMRELNRQSAEVISGFDISACTDVTGFGLIGHACEMILGSGTGFTISATALPVLPDVFEYISLGLIPEGTYRNKEFRSSFIRDYDSLDADLVDLLFDPQTSGGLLFTAGEQDEQQIISQMHDRGIDAVRIGTVTGEIEEIVIA